MNQATRDLKEADSSSGKDLSEKMSTPKIKVVVGIPSAGYTQSEAMHSIWLHAYHLGRFEAENPEFEFHFKICGRMFTPMNRERIMESALQIGADYVFMVDDDMVFKQDIFERLYRHKVDVVAALAFTRNPPHLPVLYQSRNGWDEILHRDFFITEWIKNYPKNKLVEVDAVGFGCVLIDTKCVKNMKPPYFMCSSGTGEDIFFCLKAGEAGARIFCDTSTKVGHLSNPMIIDEEMAEKHNDRELNDKLYGPYKRYGVYEVGNFPEVKMNGKEEVVLAR